jgi:hypothetical protein
MPQTKKNNDAIPQLVSIIPLKSEGKLLLKKAVRQHLGLTGKNTLYLDTKNEIILSAQKNKGEQVKINSKNLIRLTDKALSILKIKEKTQVGLVERANAIAIKTFQIIEEQGDHARFIDIEKTYKITRKVETNPIIEQFLPKLVNRHKKTKLKYNVYTFLKEKKNLEAWLSRRILGTAENSDKQLRRLLIEERLKKQQKNGSWENHVTVTARYLRELADLGMTKKDSQIQKAITWLIDRAQSKYNPGIWFATDELVRNQAEVIKRRQKQKGKGSKERFNIRKASEINLVRAGEPLTMNPCGPKISWPTALILEALLKLDCENLPRVKTALHTLTINPLWCDNSYQHGLSEWKRIKPPSMENFEAIKKYYIQFFKYGGIRNPKELARADASHQPFHLIRMTRSSSKNAEKFLLRMPEASEGCRTIMIRALSKASNPVLKKILELFLWNYAAVQNYKDGTFTLNPQRTFIDMQLAFLQLYSNYDYTIAKLVILRALPWIMNNQNKDGSWGKKPYKDIATYIVVRSLASLGNYLPSNFIISK